MSRLRTCPKEPLGRGIGPRVRNGPVDHARAPRSGPAGGSAAKAVRQAEIDSGRRQGLTSGERESAGS
jgi:hypothetical protein